MYNYFVSYLLLDKNSSNIGFGNADVTLNSKITDIKNIRDIEKAILEKENLKCISIMNYILLNGD